MPVARSAGVQSAKAFATGAWSPRLPISSLPNPMNTLMDTPMVCEGRSWRKRPLTRKWYVRNPSWRDSFPRAPSYPLKAGSALFEWRGGDPGEAIFDFSGRLAGCLCSAAAALLTILIDKLDAFRLAVASVVVGVTAAALGVLGPGAFSIDCRLFGRRKIIIPQIPRQH
jgi:hypothetical protein